jgi:hypothetical protein
MTPDNVPLLFAAFALIAASLSPVVVWFFTRRATIADRKEEREHQDRIAAQAAVAISSRDVRSVSEAAGRDSGDVA